ncbi:MAG TPA: AAA family ATPase [Pirellulales bacterium]|nr:AAA family ATPase [Pirellulales bacterium]
MIAPTAFPARAAANPPTTTSNFSTSAAAVETLKQPAAYPDRPRKVSLIETHISWVFVTDRFVYKLKKPVRFDFVDFSTPEARRRACQDECDLNQRLAAGVYLGVLPVTQTGDGRLALNGRGQTVDWVVKMRRLPADRMLDELIRNGQLSAADIEQLATWLAKYYQRLSPLCLGAEEYRKKIEQHVRDNRAELLRGEHRLPAEVVKRCHAAQLRFLALEHAQLDHRVCDGRIVDGHGDLRPEHICLEHEPVVFDCIEFNDELRRVDVADEIGFLAMECDYLGAQALGARIEAVYRRVGCDFFSAALWNFYKCYRACVRSKVAALAAAQTSAPPGDAAHQRSLAYLHLAERYAAELGPPTLILVCGLMGSGKTTLATALADRLGSDCLGTDAVRREMLGPSPAPAGFNEGHYSHDLRQHIYSELLHRAELLLRQRVSVVLDGAFLTASQRAAAMALAHAAGAVPLVAHCACPAAVAQERIEIRAAAPSLSEARAELYSAQQAEEEPRPADGSIEVDTTATLRLQEAEVIEALRRRLA